MIPESEAFNRKPEKLVVSQQRIDLMRQLACALMANLDYPESSIELTRDDVEFLPGAVEALKAFKDKNTGKCSTEVRFAAMKELIGLLSGIYGISSPELVMEGIDGSSSGNSCYDGRPHRITMRGKLSILTLLHEFCHARGMDERQAVGWSVSLFKRVYPKQYDKLFHTGHVLEKPEPVVKKDSPEKGLILITSSGGCLRAVFVPPDMVDKLRVEHVDYDDYERMVESEEKEAEVNKQIADLGLQPIY